MASPNSDKRSEIAIAMSTMKSVFLAVGFFSAVINVLYLTSSVFMIQVYDRVLSSRSMPTLIVLMVITLICYAIQGMLETVRGRVLVRIGGRLDDMLGHRVFRAFLDVPRLSKRAGESLQPIRDLDVIRGFIASMAPVAILDFPWMWLFLAFAWIMHPWLGIYSAICVVMLVGLTLLTEKLTQATAKAGGQAAGKRMMIADAARRNAEVVYAMGFASRTADRWLKVNNEHKNIQHQTTDLTSGLSSLSKGLRMIMQSGMLALAAYLTIRQEVSGGVIFASSIALSRALAPVESAIGNWKQFTSFRESYQRLTMLLGQIPANVEPMDLPAPSRQISVEAVFGGAPGAQSPFVVNVSFKLEAGQGLGLIGPSASGKSTLARTIVGAWPAMRGTVRLDGAALDQYPEETRAASVGYLPQDIELFEGSVAENISRFDPEPDPEKIVSAAKAAHVHEMILSFEDGYGTLIGEGGTLLSGGQRQRIGLARALYNDPFLVVLDEPNSNLDTAGEEALTQAILGIRARKGIVIVVAHRPSALAALDLVGVMQDGQLKGIGPRDEVLNKVVQGGAATVTPLTPVALVGKR